jgi:hypothetical protein
LDYTAPERTVDPVLARLCGELTRIQTLAILGWSDALRERVIALLSEQRSCIEEGGALTQTMGRRLLRIGVVDGYEDVFDVGLRILRCATWPTRRCGHSMCPSDRVQRSKAMVKNCLAASKELARGTSYTFLTVTGPTNDLLEGREKLFGAFREIRRTVEWKGAGVLLGRGGVENVVSKTGSTKWHQHLGMSLWSRLPIDERVVRRGFEERLAVTRVRFDPGVPPVYALKRESKPWVEETPDEQLVELVRVIPDHQWTIRFGRRGRR